MRLVFVVSPYQGDTELHLRYLRAALHDCFQRGEAPFAGHGLYTGKGVLDDANQAERARALEAASQWAAHAHATVVYTDLGISSGMVWDMHRARLEGREIEQRQLAHDLVELIREASKKCTCSIRLRSKLDDVQCWSCMSRRRCPF